MQGASGQPHQGPRVTEGTPYSLYGICVFTLFGTVILSFQTKSRHCFPSPRVACRTSGDLLGLALLVVRWNQTGPRLSLDALLLLTLPLLLTFTKFVDEPALLDKLHQLLRPLNRRTENNLLLNQFGAFTPRNEKRSCPVNQFSAFFNLTRQGVIRVYAALEQCFNQI